MPGKGAAKILKQAKKSFDTLPPLSFPGAFRVVEQDDRTIKLCSVNQKTLYHWVFTAAVYYVLLLLFDPRLLGLFDWLRRVQIFFDSAYILGSALVLGAVYFFRLKGEAILIKADAGGMMNYNYIDAIRQKSGTVSFSQIDSVLYYEHADSVGYIYIVCADMKPVFLLSPPVKNKKKSQVQEYSLTLADWIGCGWTHIGSDGKVASQLPRRN